MELRKGYPRAGQLDGPHHLHQEDLEGEEQIVRHQSELGRVLLDCWTMCLLVYLMQCCNIIQNTDMNTDSVGLKKKIK